MVSAAEALRSALHEGVLEKKRRTGGWKKKHFVLTPARWLYFDSVESADARASLATSEILKVQRSEHDAQQRGFFLVLYKKKKEYRALNTDDRDAWVHALESIAALSSTGGSSNNNASGARHDSDSSTLGLSDGATSSVFGAGKNGFQTHLTSERESSSNDSTATLLLGPNGIDLTRLCEQMKKAFSWQLQISKSFTAKDVVDFVRKHVPDIAATHIAQIGQDLIDHKLIVPLKSHVFDETDASARFKFVDAAAAAPKPPRNHLAMRAQSISDLMGNANFNARKYAEDFLKKHASEKIDVHCKKLIVQKDHTIEELKEEISANYTSFIQATNEIKRMENSVSQLKTLVLDCKRSIQCLKGVSLDISAVRKEPPGYELAEKRAEARAKSRALDSFIHDLEVHLHERSYDDFSRLLLEHTQRQQSKSAQESVSEQQQQRIDALQQQFVRRLVDEFNASMQTSERMHKKEDHLRFLIQLGEAQLATEMCLQNYSVRIALQLRHVPSYGNALNYVINLSRTFFTSLLVCYEDYEQSFRGQKSAHFISLTVWISAQLERFANEMIGHIFPQDLRARSSASTNSVAIDVPEFKNVAKYVASALRYVFYGSRQLELAGLPTAHCLAPHLVRGLVSFLASYTSSIKSTMRAEIKRERWDMARRTIRDTESKLDCEILLTQSARSFYSMIQQFLRDVQRVLNPSCATSYLPEVHDAVVLEADELLVQYTIQVQAYLENPKMSSALRLKQAVGLLTNVAYIHDDCAARSTQILLEYLPRAALQNRDVDVENAKLWRAVVRVGMQRCAQSLLTMSIRWHDLDLSDEVLPDIGGSSKSGPTELQSLFVQTLLTELHGVSNAQLEKALRAVRAQCQRDAAPDADTKPPVSTDSGDGGADGDDESDDTECGDKSHELFTTMVLEAVLSAIRDDEAWWQTLQKSSAKDRRIGYGSVNRLVAELRVVRESAHASKRVQRDCDAVIAKLTDVYQQLHPGKKDVLASRDWTLAYTTLCKTSLMSSSSEAAVASKS